MNADAVKELTLPAKTELLDTVTGFVLARLKENGCSEEDQMIIAIAAEEIFVNIAHYAYGPDGGEATVRFRMDKAASTAEISFSDRGTPYNPLARQDPDISLGAEERSIGGLGIFMVKESMDGTQYEFKDGANILTIRKKI